MTSHLSGPKQTGFTITELMVGLALAMILTLAVANVYIETRTTFRTQAAQSRLGDEGRFAMATLQRMVFQAGYRDSANMTKNALLAFPQAQGSVQAEEVIDGSSQAMTVRFYGDSNGSILSCANDAAGNADFPAVTQSQVYAYKIYVDNNQLVCASLANDGSVTANTKQVIADNVIDFKLQYGIDTKDQVADCSASSNESAEIDQIADCYADTVPATASDNGKPGGTKVFAVKMCIVVRSTETNLFRPEKKTDGTLVARSYLDCNNASTDLDSSDTRLYRTFTTAMYLRNQIK